MTGHCIKITSFSVILTVGQKLRTKLFNFVEVLFKKSFLQILSTIGLVPALILVSVISLLGCNASGVIAILCISYGCTGVASIQRIPALMSIAPRLAGTLHG